MKTSKLRQLRLVEKTVSPDFFSVTLLFKTSRTSRKPNIKLKLSRLTASRERSWMEGAYFEIKSLGTNTHSVKMELSLDFPVDSHFETFGSSIITHRFSMVSFYSHQNQLCRKP